MECVVPALVQREDSKMSKYTDFEHEKALADTKYWKKTIIDTPEKEYHHGLYHLRLKDYQVAYFWFNQAWKNEYLPAGYFLLYLIKEHLVPASNKIELLSLTRTVFNYYSTPATSDDYYHLGMLYKNGWGTPKDLPKAFECFQAASNDNHGGALYELGLHWLAVGHENGYEKARTFLRKSYDQHYENAIFKDFEIYNGLFEDYEYQREIKEAYSFKLGQHLRVAELRSDKNSYEFVISMYQNGFPGDTGAKRAAFIKKAERFMKVYDSLEK